MGTGIQTLLSDLTPELRATVDRLRTVIRETLPGVQEELDESARLIGYTYKPGTYKYLTCAVALHGQHVNLMLANGAALVERDEHALLRGTGKKARHIPMRTVADVDRPGVRELLMEADGLTPRPT